MPCTPMVQSRYEEPSSKSVRRDTLGKSFHVTTFTSCYRTIHSPAFQGLQLLIFYLPEAMVFKCADQCILSETFADRYRLEGPDATPQPRGPSRA